MLLSFLFLACLLNIFDIFTDAIVNYIYTCVFISAIFSFISYYILTNKKCSMIFSRIIFIFTVSWIFKWAVSYLIVVNWNNFNNIMVYAHSLFMISLCIISEEGGIFNRLPTLFDLYYYISHYGLKGLIDLLLKERLEKGEIPFGPFYMEKGISNATGSSSSTGPISSAGPSSSTGPSSSGGPNTNPVPIAPRPAPSASSGLSDYEYWKSQLSIYQEALKCFDKPDYQLTTDELYCRNEVKKMNEYSTDKIRDAMSLLERNINFPTDPESSRMEKVRLDLLRDAELRSESYVNHQKKQALLLSAKTKLENVVEFNSKNHARIGLSNIDKHNDETLKNLTADELKVIVDIITKDPYASDEVKKTIASGKIVGSIRGNSPIIKYLNSIIKKP